MLLNQVLGVSQIILNRTFHYCLFSKDNKDEQTLVSLDTMFKIILKHQQLLKAVFLTLDIKAIRFPISEKHTIYRLLK